MPALSRRLSRSALVGMVAWVGLLFVPLAGGLAEEAVHLVLLAPLVLVPLYLDAAVPFSFEARVPPPLAAASWLLLPGALGAAAAFLVPAGALAGLLAAPWALAAAAVAAWGASRARALWRAGALDAAEAAVTAGLVTLPVGAASLLLARAGVAPGPGGAALALAAHLHYAAFAAAVWGGLLGRALRPGLRRAHAALAAALVGGAWAVAAGIALGGLGAVEAAGAAVLAAGAVGTGALGLAVAPGLGDRAGALMVAVSGGSLALAAGLAVWSQVETGPGVGPSDLVGLPGRHGWLVAVGFGLWGALGWRRLRPRPAVVAG